MSADLILFAWSLALVAAVAAGVLLSLVDGFGRLAVSLARERRANAEPPSAHSTKCDRSIHRLVISRSPS